MGIIYPIKGHDADF